jgi:hypothetical protein
MKGSSKKLKKNKKQTDGNTTLSDAQQGPALQNSNSSEDLQQDQPDLSANQVVQIQKEVSSKEIEVVYGSKHCLLKPR